MAENDTRETGQMVEEYIGIVQQFGPSSDEATEYRQAHADIPELDEIDAVYAAVQYDKSRVWVRCTIYVVVCLLLLGIMCLGIQYGTVAKQEKQVAEGAKQDAEEANALRKATGGALNKQLNESAAGVPDARLEGMETREGKVCLEDDAVKDTPVLVSSTNSSVSINGREASEVVVRAGERCASFQIQANSVEAARMAVIVASQGTVTPSRVMVRPGVFVENLTLSESVAVGSDWVDGEVHLNKKATDDVRVELTGDHDAMISDGSVEVTDVTIQKGDQSAPFRIKTNPVFTERSVAITAGYAGLEKSVALKIRPALSASFEPTSATVTETAPVEVTLRLSREAPAPSGVTIRLDCMDPAVRLVVDDAQVTEVHLEPENVAATFRVEVDSVAQPRIAHIIARLGDEIGRTAILLSPAVSQPTRFGVVSGIPPVILAGQSVEATLQITPDSAGEPTTIKLDSSSPHVWFVVGQQETDQVVLPPGVTTARFRVQTELVDETAVAFISIRHASEEETVPLVLRAPPKPSPLVQSFEVTNDVVVGGESLRAILKLKKSPQPPNSADFHIESSVSAATPSIQGQAIRSVRVAPTATEAVFDVETTVVGEPTLARLTVSQQNEREEVYFVILPRARATSLIESFAIAPGRVVGGASTTATLRLARKARESENRTVRVESDLPGITFFACGRSFTAASILTGTVAARFRIDTPSVLEPTIARIMVTRNGEKAQQAFLLLPACKKMSSGASKPATRARPTW